jgi:hypothetical protein
MDKYIALDDTMTDCEDSRMTNHCLSSVKSLPVFGQIISLFFFFSFPNDDQS